MTTGALGALKDKMARLKADNEDLRDCLATKDTSIDQLKEQHERDECELQDVQRKLIMKEDELESVCCKLADVSSKLAEAQHSADESDRDSNRLRNKEVQLEEKVEQYELAYKKSECAYEDLDKKFMEVSRKALLLETELDRTEEKYNTAEYQRKSQAEELNMYISSLKSLQSKSEQAAEREEAYERKIANLTAALQEHEARSEEAIHNLDSLRKEYEHLEECYCNEKTKSAKLEADLQQVCQDLAEL